MGPCVIRRGKLSRPRNGDVHWPARSFDLTPLDLFLGCVIKDKVYSNNSQTNNNLMQNTEIEPQLCQKVIDNFRPRMVICRKGNSNNLVNHHCSISFTINHL